MHELAPLIKDVTIILVISSLVVLLCQIIKQPVVLGYLIAGVIVGPHTPIVFIHDEANIKILSQLGVIFLMFSLGLDFNFHKLKRVGVSATITGIIEVIFMMIIGFFAGKWLGWTYHQSLFLGAALAISSTTIIIKALEELGLKHKRFSEIIFGILIIEDLLAILLLVALSTIVTTDNIFSHDMLWSIIKLILVVGSWFLSGYFFVPWIFHKIKYYINEEILIVVSISLCLSLVYIASEFNYSAALGAFIMGSILAETPLIRRIEDLIKPIRDVFAAIFFVSIGMLIDPKIVMTHLPMILFICVITIFGKIIVTALASLLTGQTIVNSTRIGFSMAQIGEFSFIIVGLGLILGVAHQLLYSTIVAVSVITTFTTPYLIKLSAPIGEKIEKSLSPPIKKMFDHYAVTFHKNFINTSKKTVYSTGVFRLILNGVLVAALFMITGYWLFPKLNHFFQHFWITNIIAWLIALILSSPFIWGMLIAFQGTESGSKKRRLIRKPLLYIFSWIVALAEVIVLSIIYFDNTTVIISLLALACVLFGILYKQLDQSYHWLEKRLKKNLQPPLQQARYEELAPWNTYLRELEIPKYSLLTGRTLEDLQLRQHFGINIVAIYRNTETIFGPDKQELLLPFDTIIFLGNDQQAEAFYQQYFIPIYQFEEPVDLLENFLLKTITLKKFKSWVGKPISETPVQKKANCLVVGIERSSKQILNPKSSTILEPNDILFIVGERGSVEQLFNKRNKKG